MYLKAEFGTEFPYGNCQETQYINILASASQFALSCTTEFIEAVHV